MAPFTCALLVSLRFKICVYATFIIGDKCVSINHDISELFFHFICESNFSNKCITKYHIQGDSDCSIQEEDDAFNEEWISLDAEDVNFSSCISADNECSISSTISCLIVRWQGQCRKYGDEHECWALLKCTMIKTLKLFFYAHIIGSCDKQHIQNLELVPFFFLKHKVLT